MAADFELSAVITSLLEAKGFQDFKEKVEVLTDETNRASTATDTLGEESEKTSRQVGGEGRAVSALTNVLLANIGMTRGTAAMSRAAGTAFRFAGDAATALSLQLSLLTVGVALILPKIIEWLNKSDSATEAQKELAQQLVDQLPGLEQYARDVGIAADATARLADATRLVAVQDLETDIEKLAATIEDLEKKTSEGADTLARYNKMVEEGHFLRTGAFADRVKAMEAQQRRDIALLEASRAALEELIEAYAQDITVQELRRRKREEATKSLTNEKTAAKDLADFYDRQAKHELDQIQEDLDERFASFRMIDDHEKNVLADMKADSKARDEKARQDRKREAELNAARMENAREQARIDQEIADQKAITTANVIAMGGAAIASLFGRSKSAAIAGAIADTYAAAVAAYKTAGGGPWGIPIMLFTIAQGLAQVRQIESQSVGFDDPVNDLLAAQLGRKFATDVLTHINAGFGEGLRERAAGNTINQTTINRGTSINMGGVSGVIGSRTEFQKWFERTMTRAQRVQRRTSA